MTRTSKKISSLALLVLVLLFGACKGESPTAPPPGGPTPPPGTPPPAGVNVVVTASNADPLVDSTVLLTATVTLDNQPVPNGTAVEFSTTNGTFTDTNANTTIRTTTNGVATATLTSSVAGASRTTVTVNNVTRTVDVTFRARPVTQPPPSTAPSITAVAPSIGRPAGGETIRITGRNFAGPVRVLFDLGGAAPVEAFVVDRTDTTIDVITPAVNLGAGQQLVSRIIVITAAGSANEQRTEVTQGFTFRNEALTPVIHTLTPNSSPIEGGTRVSIFGEGFQAPVQVLFGAAEARIVEVRFSEIIVEAPAARDTAPNAAGPVTGPVPVTVRNINSNTTTSVADRFRYVAKMQITTVKPVVGSSLGGTDVIIEGTGFDSPLDVQIAGVQAQVLEVTGSRIRVRTGRLPSTCSGAVGGITVTNTANGDTDIYGDAPNEAGFTYNPVVAGITGVSGNLVPGGTITVTVRNPGVGANGEGSPRFTIGGRTIIPSPSITSDPTGPTTFAFALPTTGFTFPSVACTTAVSGEPGTQLGPTDAALTFSNVLAGCSDTVTVTIQPPTPNPCLTEPQPSITDPAGTCATPPPTTVSGIATTDTITITNDTEAQPLNVTSVTISGTNAGEFSIAPTATNGIPAGASRTFTLTFNPTSAGAKAATVTFNTNSPSQPQLTVCVQAQGNPDPP